MYNIWESRQLLFTNDFTDRSLTSSRSTNSEDCGDHLVRRSLLRSLLLRVAMAAVVHYPRIVSLTQASSLSTRSVGVCCSRWVSSMSRWTREPPGFAIVAY